MHTLLRVVATLFFLSGITHTAYGQLFNLNPPVITGQRPTPLITEKNTDITIAFQNLRVTDPDIFVLPYPDGYTLTVFPGANYTLTNATVSPLPGFVGTLTVQVQVNDGKFDSNIFDLKIDVINIRPVITGQNPDPISVKEGTSFTLLISHLNVDDADNKFPNDFTLTVYDGSDYTISGNTITPDPGFTGKLKVTASVNDGHEESEKAEITIDVRPNFVPAIISHVPLAVNQGNKITLELDHLTVNDPDNAYPDGFSLKVYDGPNYSVDGTSVIPSPSFVGRLKVMVTVNDGLDESKKFEVNIDVSKNEKPEITGQDALITNEDKSITITLANLKVSDKDNDYPKDFTLKILVNSGLNYSVLGHTINPATNFYGVLTIPVRVNDGSDDSETWQLSVSVTPVNDIPVITGQSEIVIRSGTSTPLDVSRLTISDPDNQNTSAFTLRILPGTNYTASGNVITPKPGFEGKLVVRVVVNDGVADSAPYNLNVEVEPPKSAPLITGQQPLVMDEDSRLTLQLTDLFVSDIDDFYPTGFTMRVHAGTDYTFAGLTVIPAQNIFGLLTVNVTVNDGNEDSAPFPLKIYVFPMNDAPFISEIEDYPASYQPGNGSMIITKTFSGDDIDSEFMTFAEVGIGDSTFNPLHDELIFENTPSIRGIYDPIKGILSLIGYASLSDYDSAIRSVRYNYILTLEEDGSQSTVLPGNKKIYFTLFDGQLTSEKGGRTIKIETSAELDIPNTFTPNGDKSNDTWRITSTANTSQLDNAQIKVFNKRGLLIYESKGFKKSWDGYFNGEVLPTDVYYYTIDLNLSFTKKTYKGTVMILR